MAQHSHSLSCLDSSVGRQLFCRITGSEVRFVNPKSRPYRSAVSAARAHARVIGARGAPGGWIYSAGGRAICQGWSTYANKLASSGKIKKNPDGTWTIGS